MGRRGKSGKDPFAEWAFDDFFQEDGLGMDKSQILGHLYDHAVASVPTYSGRYN